MTGQSGTTAGKLVAQARREPVETAEAIRSHRFLERLRSREMVRVGGQVRTAARHGLAMINRC